MSSNSQNNTPMPPPPPPHIKRPLDTGTGLLCGFRTDTTISKNHRRSLTKDQPNHHRASHSRSQSQSQSRTLVNVNTPIPRTPRPHSLTLPFQNRDRASHLISEDEFDQIMRQGGEVDERGNMPSLPSHLSGLSLGLGTRRTTSVKTRGSMFDHAGRRKEKVRPISMGFGGLGSRDPTLTALPKPPTRCDLAVYPSFTALNGSHDLIESQRQQLHSQYQHRYDGTTSRGDTPQSDTPQLPNHHQHNSSPTSQLGHKRKFSITSVAASMVESMKKRIKRPDSFNSTADSRSASPMILSGRTSRREQRVNGYTFPTPPIDERSGREQEYGDGDGDVTMSAADEDDTSNSNTDVDTRTDGNMDVDADPDVTTKAKTKSKKITKTHPYQNQHPLKQKWSHTKETLSHLHSKLPVLHRQKEPSFVEVFPRPSSSSFSSHRPTAGADTSTTSSTYFASSESSPLPFQPQPQHQHQHQHQQPSALTSTQASQAQSRPQPWQTLSREILGNEIMRLENRTMELVRRNEGYSREIEYLRGRVGELETGVGREGAAGGEDEGAKTGTVAENLGGREWEEGEEVEGDVAVGDGGSVVWKGKHEGYEDKRKTWMTCDSD